MTLKKEHSNSLKLYWKNQNSFGHWYLEFIWNLVFGIWDFKNSVNGYNLENTLQ